MSRHAVEEGYRANGAGNTFGKSSAGHIGRIGALAVALGVGMAVANSPALAWAGPTSDGQSSTSSSSSEGTSGDSSGTKSAVGSGAAESPSTSTGAEAPSTGTPSAKPKKPSKKPTKTSSSNSSGAQGAVPSSGLPDAPTLSIDSSSTPSAGSGTKSDAASTQAKAPSLKTKHPLAAPTDQASNKFHAGADDATAQPSSTPATLKTADPSPSSKSAQTVSTTSSADLAVPKLAASPAAAAAAAPASPFDFVAGVVTGLLSLFVNPVGSGNPQEPAPPSAPTIFGFLDAFRRQLEQFFGGGGGNQAQTPTLTYNPAQTTQVDNVIVGKVVASGLDNTTPVFTSSTPAHGTLVVTPDGTDPNTATFTYTATNGYAGPDAFNITVADANAPAPNIVSGLLSLFTFGLLGGTPSATQTINVTVAAQSGIEKTVLASGLNQPTDLRFLPDGRILISEKTGAIRVYNDGQMQADPLITIPVRSDWSRGLLGIEVDPDFDQNGYVYAAYITPDNYDQLSRFTVTDPTADTLTIDPDSELVLMRGDQQDADDHHGGSVRVGPDGKLYWSMGDNGWNHTNTGVISQNSQNLSNMYGKILRINTDGSVPDDNPFVNTPGALPQIYAYGFRNPYRMTFTDDGDLLVGDVGENTWEELDNVVAGGNYGWSLAEGPCNGIGATSCSSPSSFVNPIYAYQHNGQSSAITSVTPYGDKVLIADMQHGWIKELTFNGDYSSLVSEETFDDKAGTTSSLIEGPDGNIYQLTIMSDNPNNTGTLTRISPTTGTPGAD
jgi:glucose/arabinose dehydrogenase